MQTVSTYDEVESTLLGFSELNFHTVGLLLERNNLITEDGLCRAPNLLEKQSREIASSERHEAAAGHFLEYSSAKTRYSITIVIDNAHFADVIANAVKVICETHLIGNVISEAPEIDDITAGP